jgi:hypothetical protein
MIKTAKDIKIEQLRALSKRLKEILGFRLRAQSFELKDLLEAMKKEKIQTDSFSVLIANDTYCTANITQYKNYKNLNPLVWFLFFGMEDQPTFTIDFFYKVFFQDSRILQPEKTTKININYERGIEQDSSIKNGSSRIRRSGNFNSKQQRNRMGCTQRIGHNRTNEQRRIDSGIQEF